MGTPSLSTSNPPSNWRFLKLHGRGQSPAVRCSSHCCNHSCIPASRLKQCSVPALQTPDRVTAPAVFPWLFPSWPLHCSAQPTAATFTKMAFPAMTNTRSSATTMATGIETLRGVLWKKRRTCRYKCRRDGTARLWLRLALPRLRLLCRRLVPLALSRRRLIFRAGQLRLLSRYIGAGIVRYIQWIHFLSHLFLLSDATQSVWQ